MSANSGELPEQGLVTKLLIYIGLVRTVSFGRRTVYFVLNSV